MTDKTSQDDHTDTGAHVVSSVPRTAPPTEDMSAAREPEVAVGEPPPLISESFVADGVRDEQENAPLKPAVGPAALEEKTLFAGRRMDLPPVFERPFARLPPQYTRDEAPAEPAATPIEETAHADLYAPFTEAAYGLFHPREAAGPPTGQTAGHEPYDASAAPDAPPAVLGGERHSARYTRLAWKVARYAGYAALGYLAAVMMLIFVFRFVDPPASTLMFWRWISGSPILRTWVPLERISPNLVRAVIVAEDGRFCEHHGIDFQAMVQAIEQASGGAPRGASTISMQVTKNLFLWPARSVIRKAIELPLTLVLEMVWPKWRILEVYLNIAELGPGVFGAEAAARAHFRQRAARLSERQASLLAASLPNPMIRDAGDPGPRTSRKARVIQARMRAAGAGVAACVLSRKGAPPP